MAQRRSRLTAQIAQFMDEYGRKKRPGGADPNDRQYDRRVKSMVERMDPRELDEILRDGVDDPV